MMLDSSPDVESTRYSDQRRHRHGRHHHGQHGYQYLSIIDQRSPASRHLLTYLLIYLLYHLVGLVTRTAGLS